MSCFDNYPSNPTSDSEMSNWFAQAGPTESFREQAPRHLLQDNWESTPSIQPDPRVFAHVGPTPGFVYSR